MMETSLGVRVSGSGRVFSGFGIWPKYGVGIGKTINILMGSGIWLFPGKWDSPKIGHRMRDLCLRVCQECRKPSRPTSSSGQSESTRQALSGVSFATTNGPQGNIAAKTVVSLSLLENGLERLDKNIDVLSPTFSIKPEVCPTTQVENVHAVSHFKHPTCTLLEYARDFGNNMKESLKRATKWSAYYFTHANSYYPVPETKVPLRQRYP